VRYQGRIDDQYEPGIARSKPSRHDLRNAIEALIAGRGGFNAKTKAVGCLITMVKQPQRPVDPASVVTFARDVAPILNQHCVECHRDGEIGPFALTDYDEVVGWGEMMLEVIQQNRMPPWHADAKHGKFVGERRMSKNARANGERSTTPSSSRASQRSPSVLASMISSGYREVERRSCLLRAGTLYILSAI